MFVHQGGWYGFGILGKRDCGELIENDGNLDNLPEGIYQYLVTDRYGCVSESNYNLMSPSPLTVDLGEDRLVELGDGFILTPFYSDPVVDVVWSSVDSIDCVAECGPFEYLPTTSQVLSVMAFTEQGCIGAVSYTHLTLPTKRIV